MIGARLGVRLGMPIAVLLAACGALPTQNYYVLTATIGAPATASSPSPPLPATVVYIDPAHLPEVVDRPQLVVSAGNDSNRVTILEQQRWGEPLRAAIPQVLAIDLERQLASARVTAAPQDTLPDGAWRLTLDVQRFEARPGEAVTIEIAWILRKTGGDPTPAKSGRSSARESIAANDYAAIAAAYSRALAMLSRDIAAALSR